MSLSAEDRFASHKDIPTHFDPHFTPRVEHHDDGTPKPPVQPPHPEHDENHVGVNHALKFLLAGGVAGAGACFMQTCATQTAHTLFTLSVSRTATAPFDRLKVFLITRPTDMAPLSKETILHPERSAKAIGRAIASIYAEGGVMGFWVGNGLNIAKIFPVRHPWLH